MLVATDLYRGAIEARARISARIIALNLLNASSYISLNNLGGGSSRDAIALKDIGIGILSYYKVMDLG